MTEISNCYITNTLPNTCTYIIGINNKYKKICRTHTRDTLWRVRPGTIFNTICFVISIHFYEPRIAAKLYSWTNDGHIAIRCAIWNHGKRFAFWKGTLLLVFDNWYTLYFYDMYNSVHRWDSAPGTFLSIHFPMPKFSSSCWRTE